MNPGNAVHALSEDLAVGMFVRKRRWNKLVSREPKKRFMYNEDFFQRAFASVVNFFSQVNYSPLEIGLTRLSALYVATLVPPLIFLDLL